MGCRELKFRFIKDGKIQGVRNLIQGGILDVPWEWDEVNQFTGLMDKSGKEIWEGDIVKTGEGASIGTVVFKDCAFRVEPFVVNVLDLFDYVEVIGNIYEHGRLLESK